MSHAAANRARRKRAMHPMSPAGNVDAVFRGMPCKCTAEDYPATRAALVTAADRWAQAGNADRAAAARLEIADLDAEFTPSQGAS